MRAKEFITEMAALGVPGLFKYQGTKKDRIPVFLDKLANQSPFQIKTTTGVEDIILDPSELPKVQTWIQNPTSRLTIKSLEDTPRDIPFGSLIKTKEFGGEVAGQREAVEQGQIEGISQELEAAKNGQPFVRLKVGKRVVNAARVDKTPELINGRAPKSDMTVYDENDQPVAWVSLKDKTFRWGGWQHLMYLPDIAKWLKKVVKKTNGGVFLPGQAFGHHIPGDVANLIVFGKDFGTGKPGISNVDLVVIGWATVKKGRNKTFVLSGDTTYSNGETPTGPHEPYLVLRYMLSRNDVGMRNARGETNTKSEGRKVIFL